jgi:hypothetical protein
LAVRLRHIGGRDHRHERVDCAIDGTAQRPRRAIDMFERWRKPLKKQDGAFGAKHAV